jgi:hypothetical protein
MKKYKLSEVIAMLEKNPELRFIRKASNFHENDVEFFLKNGRFRTNSNTDAFMAANLFNWEFELIQQPVTFIEAVKAYAEGKTIRCEFGNIDYIYKPTELSGRLVDQNKIAIGESEILEGTWYIEEGDSND